MGACIAAATSAAANPPHTVDLDAPGAIAALQKSNPALFTKLGSVLHNLMTRDEATIERVVRTAGGTSIERGQVIKTSYPAKAPLWFVLDDTRYVITVTVPDPRQAPKPR
jgi:hypothetical protein